MTWKNVAAATATILVSIAMGAGGFFVTQQIGKDARQDDALNSAAGKLVDVAVKMVEVTQSQKELKSGLDDVRARVENEVRLRETRDQAELADLRREKADRERGKR